MEKQLLESYEGFDDLDSRCFQFYKPVLKFDIGSVKAGPQPKLVVVIDYENGILTIQKDISGEVVEVRNMILTIEPIAV